MLTDNETNLHSLEVREVDKINLLKINLEKLRTAETKLMQCTKQCGKLNQAQAELLYLIYPTPNKEQKEELRNLLYELYSEVYGDLNRKQIMTKVYNIFKIYNRKTGNETLLTNDEDAENSAVTAVVDSNEGGRMNLINARFSIENNSEVLEMFLPICFNDQKEAIAPPTTRGTDVWPIDCERLTAEFLQYLRDILASNQKWNGEQFPPECKTPGKLWCMDSWWKYLVYLVNVNKSKHKLGIGLFVNEFTFIDRPDLFIFTGNLHSTAISEDDEADFGVGLELCVRMKETAVYIRPSEKDLFRYLNDSNYYQPPRQRKEEGEEFRPQVFVGFDDDKDKDEDEITKIFILKTQLFVQGVNYEDYIKSQKTKKETIATHISQGELTLSYDSSETHILHFGKRVKRKLPSIVKANEDEENKADLSSSPSPFLKKKKYYRRTRHQPLEKRDKKDNNLSFVELYDMYIDLTNAVILLDEDEDKKEIAQTKPTRTRHQPLEKQPHEKNFNDLKEKRYFYCQALLETLDQEDLVFHKEELACFDEASNRGLFALGLIYDMDVLEEMISYKDETKHFFDIELHRHVYEKVNAFIFTSRTFIWMKFTKEYLYFEMKVLSWGLLNGVTSTFLRLTLLRLINYNLFFINIIMWTVLIGMFAFICTVFLHQ